MSLSPLVLLLIGGSQADSSPVSCKTAELVRSDPVTVRRGAQPVQVGSGRTACERRLVGRFSRVDISDGVKIVLTQGGSSQVVVQADENLLPAIVTRVEGLSLKIEAVTSYTAHHAPVVTIETPELAEVNLDSSGKAVLHGVQGPSLTIAISGSGGVVADGQVDTLHATLSGSGTADLRHLRARDVNVTVSGSGQADVNASRALTAVSSGSGDILYTGGATRLSAITNGSGRVMTRP